MNQIFRSKFLWINAVLILLLMTVAQQRATAQDQDQDDPPGRVARLGYIEGSVSFEPAGEQDWVEATPNRPMTTGDQLWVDRDSRAEVQLGSASTALAVVDLENRGLEDIAVSGSAFRNEGLGKFSETKLPAGMSEAERGNVAGRIRQVLSGEIAA